MKRWLTIFSIVVAFVLLLSSNVFAAEVLDYTLNTDGKGYTVTGIGTVYDTVIIPSEYNGLPVTTIGQSAFYENTTIKSVTIADSVKTIEWGAFYGCTSLSEVNFGNGLTDIGGMAFLGCTALESVILQDGVKTIQEASFQGCTALQSFVMPDSVEEIWVIAFDGCTSIVSIDIPRSVLKIEESVFCYWTSSQTINYDGTEAQWRTIAHNSNWEENNEYKINYLAAAVLDYALNTDGKGYTVTGIGTAYDTVVIPLEYKGVPVTTIGQSAFYENTTIKSVTISDSVKTIEWGAFLGCTSLNEVNFGKGLTDICGMAFLSCTSLESVVLQDGLKTIQEAAFEGCTGLKSFVMPDSVEEIWVQAFNGCAKLTSLRYGGTILQWSLVNREEENLWGAGDWDCNTGDYIIYCINGTISKAGEITYTDIASGNCGSNVTWKLNSDGLLIISGTGNMSDYAYNGTPWYAYNTNVKRVIIEEGVTSIGSHSFYWFTNLASVSIPTSVTSIGYSAFKDCMSLQTIKIPDGVKSIGASTFSGCKSLNEIFIPQTVVSILDDFDCQNLSKIEVDEKNLQYCSRDGVLFSKNMETLIRFPEGKKSNEFIIPSGISEIRGGAFENCDLLSGISIPSTVSTIGAAAFENCSSLSSIRIPCSVAIIDFHAFMNASIKEIVFAGNAPSIGSRAFFGVKAVCYYPDDDITWTDEKRANYGGNLTWLSSDTCVGHSFTEYYQTEEATCLFAAVESAKCDFCNESSIREIPNSMLEHVFKEYSNNQNATCQKNGTETALCEYGCGTEDTHFIENSTVAHKYSKYYFDNNASCEIDGTETALCDFGCGAEDIRVSMGSKLGHDYSEEIISEPTCTNAGVKTFICANDRNHAYTETFAALGHDTVKHNAKTATCEGIGWEAYETCTRCDYSTYKEHPAIGHDYSGEVTEEPSCIETGTMTYTCQNDSSHTYTEEIETTSHNFNSSIVKFQWTEDYDCVADVYCANLCGATEQHDCEVSSVTVEGADCQTKGTITYTAKYLSYSDTKTIEGTVGKCKPSSDATCTDDQICTVCKTVLVEASGHIFDSKPSDTVASEANCTEPARHYVQCENCNEITEEKTVSVGEAKGHHYDKPYFNWADDLSSASAVLVCSDCDQGVLRGTCKLEWTSEIGKLTVTATVTLNGQEYTDNKVITMTVSNGKVIVYLPAAMPDITIFGVGYGSNHAMGICETEKADKTVVELPVSGETIKLFFLDKDTFAPVAPCVVVQ